MTFRPSTLTQSIHDLIKLGISIFLLIGTSALLDSNSLRAAELPPLIDLTVANPHSIRIFGEAAEDRLGSGLSQAVAFGDINGDSIDDLIVGSDLSDPAGRADAGQVYIVLGSSAFASQDIQLGAPGASIRIQGSAAGDHLGITVTCGDFDEDGFDDVILGADKADGAGRTDSGKVFVIYGSITFASGQIIDLANPGATVITTFHGAQAGDHLGKSLCVGNINGDAIEDIIIGSPGASTAGRSLQGFVDVIFGSASLRGAAIDLNGAPDAGRAHIIGAKSFAQAGFSVAAGDANGDSFDDLIIGAPSETPSELPEIGRHVSGIVYILFGAAEFPGRSIDLAVSTAPILRTRILGLGGGDNLGTSLAAGDVTGDGFDDVLVGVPGAFDDSAQPNRTDAGKILVFQGTTSLPSRTVDMANIIGSPFTPREIFGDVIGGQVGNSVSTGDVNGDGFLDVIVGSWRADYLTTGTLRTDSGDIRIVPGQFPFPPKTIFRNQAPVVRVFGSEFDMLASGTAANGDLNGDGIADFAGSAFLGDNPLIGTPDNKSGYVAAIKGDGTATTATLYKMMKPLFTEFHAIGGRLSPVMRTEVKFDGGGGPGVGTRSLVKVSTARSGDSISGLGDGTTTDKARVMWKISTNRLGYLMSYIKLKYLDSEITGMTESSLRLYQAASPVGPWTEVSIQAIDLGLNEIVASVPQLGHFVNAGEPEDQVPYFAIRGDLTVQPSTTEKIRRYLLGTQSDSTGLDLNADGAVDSADFLLALLNNA